MPGVTAPWLTVAAAAEVVKLVLGTTVKVTWPPGAGAWMIVAELLVERSCPGRSWT